MEAHSYIDVFTYQLSFGDYSIVLDVFVVDFSTPCGPNSNTDFVHFILENFEKFAFEKYAMALLPSDDSDPKMMYLTHYRAESEDWKDQAQCYRCSRDYKDIVLTYTFLVKHLPTLPVIFADVNRLLY